MAFQEDSKREKIIDGMELKPFTKKTETDKTRLRVRLEEIRRQGYAISWGELNVGLVSIIVPVFDRFNEVVASLSIGLPEARAEAVKLDYCIKILLEGGREVSRQMGFEA